MPKTPDPSFYVRNISKSGLSIYDSVEIGDPKLWIPAPALENLLNARLRGLDLGGLPLRTRSKRAKAAVCGALGYPVPTCFARTQPRFPGQLFDTYVQKSNNLQVFNEELAPARRYVIIRVSEESIVQKIKVVTGESLSKFDTTGTLTQKSQARLICAASNAELISPIDTDVVAPLSSGTSDLNNFSPTDDPEPGSILPIAEVFTRLQKLVGASFAYSGHDQERRRGAELHRLVCKTLGYSSFADNGQFPDIRNQLLEVKLQTSPTIDLGLICPNSDAPIDVTKLMDVQIRHCDVRYALFYAKTDGTRISITHLFLTTGEVFFSRFPRFQGKVLNKKLQVRLPSNFFN